MKKFICAALSLLLITSSFSSCSSAVGDSSTDPENGNMTISPQNTTEASGVEESTTDTFTSTEAETSTDIISFG